MHPAVSAARDIGASLFNDKWVRVRQQHVAQMALAEHHDVINAFPADRADQPFCGGVLSERARRRRTISNTDGSNQT